MRTRIQLSFGRLQAGHQDGREEDVIYNGLGKEAARGGGARTGCHEGDVCRQERKTVFQGIASVNVDLDS